MKIKIKDVIKLNDGNEYVVVSIAVYEKKDFVYIVDINDNTKFKIAKIEGNKLIEIPDNKELVRKLIVIFYQNAVKSINMNELIRQGQRKTKK